MASAQPVTPKELGEMLQMDKGFVSRILTGFVRRKLLRKIRNPQDARSWVLQLTPSGEQSFPGDQRGFQWADTTIAGPVGK
ncbi:MAG: MarR family transcriptional regulator [Saprospiraceae bacterium]